MKGDIYISLSLSIMFGISKLDDFCIVLLWKKYILVTFPQFECLDILILKS